MPMKTVATQLVEQGVGAVSLMDWLLRDGAIKPVKRCYGNSRVNLIGSQGNGLKPLSKNERIEDRNRFEELVQSQAKLGIGRGAGTLGARSHDGGCNRQKTIIIRGGESAIGSPAERRREGNGIAGGNPDQH